MLLDHVSSAMRSRRLTADPFRVVVGERVQSPPWTTGANSQQLNPGATDLDFVDVRGEKSCWVPVTLAAPFLWWRCHIGGCWKARGRKGDRECAGRRHTPGFRAPRQCRVPTVMDSQEHFGFR